ncbi:MAG: polysaccharide biosynthesis protein [Chitinophagaceae bacterium]
MNTIRKQSIISSIIVYIGFALGFLNTYLFTRQGGLTAAQYGLTNTFVAIASIIFSIAGLGMPAYIGKFFPYYKAHLDVKKNDQLAWALLVSCTGFAIVAILGVLLKPILIDRVFANSPELPQYYYWMLVFSLGYTIYMVLEMYSWQHQKAILTNFLKEISVRLFVTILLIAASFGWIKQFDAFIGIYSFSYITTAIILIVYLLRKNKFYLTFTISRVTRRLFKKMLPFVSFIWGSGMVLNIASVFDGIIIAAVLPNGMASAGIYYLAQTISSLMQAPQRAIISASVGPIAQAWKEKDYGRLNRIYQRSSINQLLFSIAMFCLIWLNFDDGIHTFQLQEKYTAAKWIFFYIGLAKIVDMGTGLNAQIIATSNFWRFEFLTGIFLLLFTLPMNYEITRHLGNIGPAISNLITFTIYNAIRYTFLLRKFKMQPFNAKTAVIILIAAMLFGLCYLLFNNKQGFIWIVLRSSVFTGLFIASVLVLKISPDIIPVWQTLKKKIKA